MGLGGHDDAAGESFAAIPGWLCPEVVGILVNDHGFSDDICCPELVGKKAHPRVPVIGKEYGEVAGMVAVRLVGRVPVASRCGKRIVGIADCAHAVVVQVKAKRTDRLLIAGCRLVGR